MTDIEDRLRRDLPVLADRLLAGEQPRAVIGLPRHRRRVAVAVAAAVVAIALASATLFRSPEATEVRTDPAGEANASSIDLGSWSPLPDATVRPRNHPLSGLIDGRVVFAGGATTTGGVDTAYSDAAAYDPASDEWKALPNASFGHPKSQGVAIGSTLFAEAKGRIYRIETDSGDTAMLPELPGGLGTIVGVAAVNTQLWAVGISQAADGSRQFAATTSARNQWTPPSAFGGFNVDDDGSPHTLTADSARIIVDAGTTHGAIFDTRVSAWAKLETPPVSGTIVGAVAVATPAGIAALIESNNGPASEVVVALNDGRGWSVPAGPIDLLPGTTLTDLELVPAGQILVVLGSGAPLLIDPLAGRWVRASDSPLRNTEGMVGVWTGSEVVVWGGQEAGSRGAIWRPSDQAPASRRSGVVCIPPAAIVPSQGLVGVPIGFAMSGGVRPGFRLGPISTRTIALPNSEQDSTLVVAEVQASDGRSMGTGIWLSGDAIASFGGDGGGGDQQSWAEAPWKMPRSTNLHSVNEIAQSATVWTAIDDSVDSDELVRSAQPCGTG